MNNYKYLLAAAMLIGLSSHGATYYVATNGNDSAAGTNVVTAWRTIQKAANTVVAGDIVRVQAGTYTEQVSETTDGTSSSPITYLCDGAVQLFGGWQISGDYVKIIGFDISQSNNLAVGYDTVYVNSARGVQILGNHIHHTSAACVGFRAAHDLVIRGNTMTHSKFQDYPYPVTGGDSIVYGGVIASTNVLIEYNQLAYGGDYINNNVASGFWIIRNNLFGPAPSDSGQHLDNFQPNAATTNVLMEANWDEGNNCTDHHFIYLEVDTHNHFILRGNVYVSSGYASFGGVDNSGFYHNTFYGNTLYFGGTDVGVYVNNQGGTATNNELYNNIFANSCKSFNSPIQVQSGSSATYDYNLSYGQAAMASGTHNLTSNPLFVSTATNVYNMTLQSSSPARNAGGAIARATNGGTSSTALTVGNAYLFWPGDRITIGGTATTVASINSAISITLGTAVSWTSGAVVLWRGQTDIGAFPYKAGGYSYSVSVSPTGTVGAGNVTITANVTNAEVVRMVEFRVDGVPLSTATASPYTAQWNATGLTGAHTIEARAYPLYAGRTLVNTATATVTVGVSTLPVAPGALTVTQ